MLSNKGQKPVLFVKKIIGEMDGGFYFRGGFLIEDNCLFCPKLVQPPAQGALSAFCVSQC